MDTGVACGAGPDPGVERGVVRLVQERSPVLTLWHDELTRMHRQYILQLAEDECGTHRGDVGDGEVGGSDGGGRNGGSTCGGNVGSMLVGWGATLRLCGSRVGDHSEHGGSASASGSRCIGTGVGPMRGNHSGHGSGVGGIGSRYIGNAAGSLNTSNPLFKECAPRVSGGGATAPSTADADAAADATPGVSRGPAPLPHARSAEPEFSAMLALSPPRVRLTSPPQVPPSRATRDAPDGRQTSVPAGLCQRRPQREDLREEAGLQAVSTAPPVLQ
eukprot:366538-Chlamydomonas_euryale.AAC.14